MWVQGIYLGRERKAGQHELYDEDLKTGAHSRTVMRMPDPQKWSGGRFAAISMIPNVLHVAKDQEPIFKIKNLDEVELKSDPVRMERRVYGKDADLERFRYTPGCKK